MLLALLLLVAVPEPERVAAARERHEAALMARAEVLDIAWPPKEVYVRAFKDERTVEVWVGDGASPMVLFDSFLECGASGGLGPKVQQGDLQVPEGFYTVRNLNPWSPGLLSLQLDYPNAADRGRRRVRHAVRAAALAPATVRPEPLGGDIAVHGTCISTGCLAIDDAPIEQLYLLALEPRRRGSPIRVHVFPTRMTAAHVERAVAALAAVDTSGMSDVEEASVYAAHITALRLWASLVPAYDAFERTRRPPATWPRDDGTYRVRAR